MKSTPWALIGLFSISLFVMPASAFELRGSVSMRAPRQEPLREALPSFYVEQWNGFLDPAPMQPQPDREVAVVLIGSGASSVESVAQIHGGDFMPSTVVVSPGTTLRIENRDDCSHELFSDTLEGFTALPTAPENARTVAIPAAGQWVVRDRLYAHVTGYIHAVANLVARATVQDSGRFVFPNVEAGTYTLKIFFRDREIASQPVEVTPRGLALDPIELNLDAR